METWRKEDIDMKAREYIGKKFNMLTVEEIHHRDKRYRAFFKCRCDCGNECIVRGDGLLNGNNKSCGCMLKNHLSEGGHKLRHGQSGTRLYHEWKGMRDRCSAFGKDRGKDYAERGIKICDEWDAFETFQEWALLNGYEDDLTIERIDVNGDYEPSNCKWISLAEQQKNKTNTLYVTIDGERKRLKDACEEYGVSYMTAYQRICRLGWSEEEAVKHGGKRI